MVSTNASRNIVGIIGNVISVGLLISPMPTFYKIWKRGAVEKFSPIPYLATLLNCMMWVFYGIPIVHPNSLLVLTVNSIGICFETFYLIVFFTYATKRQRVKVLSILTIELLFMCVVVILVIMLAHTHKQRSLFVGILCVIFGTSMYASPLTVMKMVITTKSVKYMPFYLSLANFLNGICWTIYALIQFDLFIMIPNGLGALFGAAQLILYSCYYKSTPKDGGDKPKIETRLQMSTLPVAPSNGV